LPSVPSIALSDPLTGSTTHTNHAANTIAITGDMNAVKWCVLESLSTDPDPAGHVSTSAGTDTLEFPLPSSLTMTGPASVTQFGCSDPITVTALDSYGLTSPAATANAVTLTGAGSGSFYSDAGCTAAITQTLGAGESSRVIYYKSSATGALTLQAAGFSATPNFGTTVVAPYMISGGKSLEYGFTCAVVNGAAQCFGSNERYQLGNNAPDVKTNPNVAVQVTGLTIGVSQISAGNSYACAVVNGAAQCWGDNWTGQLGSAGGGLTPQQVTGLTSGVRRIDAGANVACAVVGESARCWGINQFGQLGNGTTGGSTNAPVQVTGLTSGVTQVVAGDHSCAIAAGALKCWGRNHAGQLGNNSMVNSNVPVNVTGMSSGVTAVAVNPFSTCAVQNGGLYCWGENAYGQTTGSVGSSSSVPVAIPGLSTGVTDVSMGGFHTCAVVNGAARCWGLNSHGQVGSGAIGTAFPPTDVPSLTTGVTDIEAGYAMSCARVVGNQFKCWGAGSQGQRGDATPLQSTVPVAVTGLATTVSSISISNYDHACALLTNGRIQCWGEGSLAQLGDGNWIPQNSPVYVSGISSGATSVSAGLEGSCATVSGQVLCWGSPFWGTPIQVGSLATLATKVSWSGLEWYSYGCAVVDSGVQCWGANYAGTLGNGTVSNSSLPVSVSGIPAGSNATDITTGADHACAVVNGEVRCWGDNNYGQLGDGTFTQRLTPVTVVASGATSVSAGIYHTCAVVNGGAKCWGVDWYGQLGTNDGFDHEFPTDVQGLTSGVAAISVSELHTCALMISGAVKCWGANRYGEIGNASTTIAGAPQDVLGISSGATSVSTGPYTSCAVVGGAGKCWGANIHGQLGNQAAVYSNALSSPIFVGSPAKLSVTGPASSTSATCSTAFTIRLRDVTGALVNAGAAINVALGNGGTGSFYALPACAGGTVTTVQIPSGSDTATFYYQAPTAQTVGITAIAPNLIPTAIKHQAN
jgi:alpha-tubulin suppressor-like RCC1 family protein